MGPQRIVGPLLLLACAELPAIEDGVCGNGVVEAGEDCDSFGIQPNTVCAGPADTVRACRYVCSQTATCPNGWACGADSVCRYGSGRYEEASGSPYEMSGKSLGLADFDGDNKLDIMALGPETLAISFGAGDGTFPELYAIDVTRPSGVPAVGDLDGDQRADVVIPTEDGLYLMQGQTERSLAPFGQVAFDLQSSERIVPLAMGKDDVDELLFMQSVGGNIVLSLINVTYTLVVDPPLYVEELAGRIPVADLDHNRLTQRENGFGDAEELALVLAGEYRVWIFQVASVGGVQLRSVVALPGPIMFGVRFVDANGDGWLDLMASVNDGSFDRVALAFGDGGGGFGPAAIEPGFDLLRADGQTWPLAAADLDGDGVTDYVSRTAIWTLQPGNSAAYAIANNNGSVRWVEAEIADFNWDGAADVALASEQEPGIDLLFGMGAGLFAPFHVDTKGRPHLLRAADYDGDLVTDLAMCEEEVVDGKVTDNLSVVFGSGHSAPDPAVFMGRLDSVYFLEPAHLPTNTRDYAADLVVQSVVGEGEVQRGHALMLMGNAHRRMAAPLVLRQARTSVAGDVAKAVFIRAGLDGIANLVAVAPPHLWGIDGTGGGRFDAPLFAVDVTALVPGQALTCHLWAWDQGDIDGNGRAVITVAGDSKSTCARSLVGFYYPEVGWSPNVVVTELDERFERVVDLDLADLDRNGRLDLVVTSAKSVGVFWLRPDGWLALDNPSIVPLDEPIELSGVAALNVDNDERLELAILGDHGVMVAKFDGFRQFAKPGAPIFVSSRGPGLSIFASDVNADGLDDLVFKESISQVRVLLATWSGSTP